MVRMTFMIDDVSVSSTVLPITDPRESILEVVLSTWWVMATLDSVLGPGLANPRKEVDTGDFSIDIVAETNVGDIVIRRRVRTRAPSRRD